MHNTTVDKDQENRVRMTIRVRGLVGLLNAGLQAERLRHKSELTALTGSLCIPDGSGRHSQ